MLGEEFEGVLVSDFYASYNVHQGYHQRCWVHLLRNINKLTEGCPDHQQLAQWATDVTGLFQLAKDYPGPDRLLYSTPRAQNQQRVRDGRDFADRLLSICQPYLAKQTPMTTFCSQPRGASRQQSGRTQLSFRACLPASGMYQTVRPSGGTRNLCLSPTRSGIDSGLKPE